MPLTSSSEPAARFTPAWVAAIVIVPASTTRPCTRPSPVEVCTNVPATEMAPVAPSVRSALLPSAVLPTAGAFSVSDTLPPGALMRPSTRSWSMADSDTVAPASALTVAPSAIVTVAWPANRLLAGAFSDRLTGLRCDAGNCACAAAARTSPPVAMLLAATVSSTRVCCCSSTCAPDSMPMPWTAFTVTLEKPRSANNPGPSRVVLAGNVPLASAASITTRGVLSTSLPPLPNDRPDRSACNQSELSVVETPFAIDSVPPSPAVSLRVLLSDAPPPTSSTAPRSSSVAESLPLLVAIVMRPPASVDEFVVVVVPVEPSTETFCRAEGKAPPTNEPSALALLIHTPAVDSAPLLRTVTLLLVGPSSGRIGALVARGCSVMLPAGIVIEPATSTCGARTSSDEPGAPSIRTASGTRTRPFELISTESKAFCT